MGTKGHEHSNRFRGPGFAQTDFGLAKRNPIEDRMDLQPRLEFCNLFVRVNLTSTNSDLFSSSFGKATSQYNLSWIQLSGKFTFY
jgi:hypothetical protein